MLPTLIRQCKTLISIGFYGLHVKDGTNVNTTIENSFFNWFVCSPFKGAANAKTTI